MRTAKVAWMNAIAANLRVCELLCSGYRKTDETGIWCARLLRALRTFYVEDAAKLSLPLVALPRSR
jgi:hypothetical protein